ncbi:MAG: methyltransferase domain-containing protein [Bryobacteraceae bacterium]
MNRTLMKRTLLSLATLLAVPALHLLAQQKGAVNDKTKLAPYYPTPEIVVDKMLSLAGVKPGEKVYDLGSGDGRIPIAAARKYKAQGVGVELDESLVRQSTERIRTLGLTPSVKIIQGDLLLQDYTSADVLTIYLLPVAIEKVTPILEKQLKKGARVVAHDFEFFTWNPPAKIVDIDDDGEGRSHRLFLYRR